MENSRGNFFWPSYVDLMTSLFAIALVLFVFTYYTLNKRTVKLAADKVVLQHDVALLNKVKANFTLFDKNRDIFTYNDTFKRLELNFEIQFRTGFQYFKIDNTSIANDYLNTIAKLNVLGRKLKQIIDTFMIQKESDTTMKDISYLMVISGTASHLRKNDDTLNNETLSFDRALYLYKYWKDSLGIDFDSPNYHKIIELQISGMGFGGLGRYNGIDETKNQRFIISIAPKIGR
jgi:hypothetical protein